MSLPPQPWSHHPRPVGTVLATRYRGPVIEARPLQPGLVGTVLSVPALTSLPSSCRHCFHHSSSGLPILDLSVVSPLPQPQPHYHRPVSVIPTKTTLASPPQACLHHPHRARLSLTTLGLLVPSLLTQPYPHHPCLSASSPLPRLQPHHPGPVGAVPWPHPHHH